MAVTPGLLRAVRMYDVRSVRYPSNVPASYQEIYWVALKDNGIHMYAHAHHYVNTPKFT